MSKYKVGDLVKVRSDLIVGEHYNGIGFGSSMKKYYDSIVTIAEVRNNNVYRIKEDGAYWNWTKDMFEETNTVKKEIKEDKNMDIKIKDYKVDANKKTVVVFFADGDTQKAKCCEGDTFNFTTGLEICVMKHLCGGADKYYKAIKVATEQILAVAKAKEKAEEEKARIARKREKRMAKKAARAERRREERIAEMKEAYVAAVKELDSINFEKAIEVIESSVQ